MVVIEPMVINFSIDDINPTIDEKKSRMKSK